MAQCLYSKKNYRIIKCAKNSYLVINKDKEFKYGHTHMFNYKLAKIVVYTCVTGSFPPKSKALIHNKRMLQSIVRVCGNKYLNNFKIELEKK